MKKIILSLSIIAFSITGLTAYSISQTDYKVAEKGVVAT